MVFLLFMPLLGTIGLLALLYTWIKRRKTVNCPKDFHVAIIGAGASGLCMAIKLKERGIPFTVYEKLDNLGGTWYLSDYPGSGCDIPSFLYSYSFAPNPNWSRKWAKQPEILEYFNSLAKKYGILDHIKFNTAVQSMKWNETTSYWDLTLHNNTTGIEKVVSNIVVSGVGQLHVPSYPTIAGFEGFQGDSFHTARWDHSVDLKDKVVGMIGNAASAVQIVPEIAHSVKKLYIFQRTPNYVFHKHDYHYPSYASKLLGFIRLPHFLYRSFLYFTFEKNWLLFKDKTNALLSRYVNKELDKALHDIPDAKLRNKLVPNYAAGCKRVLISDNYYSTLSQMHSDQKLKLVTKPIRSIDTKTVTYQSSQNNSKQTEKLDVLIFATGYNTHHFITYKIEGKSGLEKNPRQYFTDNYLGISVTDFPNYFLLYGPGTNSGHSSILFMVENQVAYIMQALESMIQNNLKEVQVKEDVVDTYQQKVDKAADTTVWTKGCNSWYTDKETGKLLSNYPWSSLHYWWSTRKFNSDDYTYVH